MKVKILRNTVADKKSVKAGDVLDLQDKEAKFLINLGKAQAMLAEFIQEVVKNEIANVMAPSQSEQNEKPQEDLAKPKKSSRKKKEDEQ